MTEADCHAASCDSYFVAEPVSDCRLAAATSAKWKSRPILWHSAKGQLAIQFGERFMPNA